MPGILDRDPLSGLDPLSKLRIPALEGGGRRPDRAFFRQPLPPEEEESLATKTLHAGSSLLHYGLTTLDKPGQAVRGLLAGKGLSSLKHLVPFGGTMGLTTEEDNTSGRDLTDKLGLTQKSDQGWGAWGTGLAAEIATDPLTFLDFGPKHAMTAIGQVAKKAGALKGFSRKQLLQGFHAAEEGLLHAGKTAETVAHMKNQGSKILAPEVERAVMEANPEKYVSRLARYGPDVHKFETIGTTGKVAAEGASQAEAYKLVEDMITKMSGPLPPGTTIHGTYSQTRKLLSPAIPAPGVARQPLAGLVRVGVPFGPKMVLGTGRYSQAIAGGLDKFGSALRFGNPIGRVLGSKFDTSVGEAVDKLTQQGWEKFGDPAMQEGKRLARAKEYGLISKLDPIIRAGTHNEEDITNAAIALAEGAPHKFDPALVTAVDPVANQVRAAGQRYMKEAEEIGLPLKNAEDQYVDYVHREALKAGDKGSPLQLQGDRKLASNIYPVISGSNLRRQSVFRNVPGGQLRINDWFDRFAGLKDKKSLKLARKEIAQDMQKDFLAGGRFLPELTPEVMAGFDKHASKLARRIGHSDEIYRTAAATADTPARVGLPFFSPDLAATQAQREMQHVRTMAAAKAALGTLGMAARPFDEAAGDVALPVMLRKLGLLTRGGEQLGPVVKGTPPSFAPMQGAMLRMWERLAPKGVGPIGDVENIGRKALKQQLGGWGVSAQHAEQILKAYGKWKAPEQIKATVRAYDSLANAFKALTYPIWIPSHVRNAFTAGLNNLTNGAGLWDHLAQFKVMTGRGNADLSRLNPSLKGLPLAEQLDRVRKAQYASAGIFGDTTAANEIAGSAMQGLLNRAGGTGPDRFTPFLPGAPSAASTGNVAKDAANLVLKEGLLGSLKATGKTAWNALRDPLAFSPHNWGKGRIRDIFEPVAIRGVAGAAADALPAVSAGRTAGTHIENFFRGALWNSQVRKGLPSDIASELVDRVHFNYGDRTQFEKNVMGRLMPFYTYARKNLPYQLNLALTRPGLFHNQYRPFFQNQDQGYVPEYLRSGVAIPTGPEDEEGRRQYISKLGLPAEEAFERIHFMDNRPDLRATAMDYLGQLNPLIKAPLEQLFDTQLHTQRRLSDLKSTRAASAIGKLVGEDNPQLLAQILANSPLTRFASSADKILDDRKNLPTKLVNLFSGVRVTDVDVNRIRAVELRNKLEELMRKQPHLSKYVNFYVTPEQVENLTPEEVELMRFYSGLQDKAKAFSKSLRVGVRNR